MRLLFLLCCLPCITLAQFTDDFNDGEIVFPLWAGDTTEFTVSNQVLQLNATAAGSSSLTYSRGFPVHHDHEWSFRLKLAFSPSSQNYSRYYLFCDAPDPLQSIVALYLQLGESGSADAPELKLFSNNSTQTIARGINASIAMPSDFLYKLQCDSNNNWTLSTRDNSGNETVQFTTQYLISQNGSYGGFHCTYTQSNLQNFYLDDVYDDVLRHDTLPPDLLYANAITSDSVLLHWNEPVDLSQSAFMINGINCNSHTVVDDKSIALFFPSGFTSGHLQKVVSLNVKDTHGNNSNSDSASFTYIEVVNAAAGMLYINEIMSAPDNANQLPDAEYIELANITEDYIFLDSIIISDGTSEALILHDTIFPHGFKVYSNPTDAIELNHSNIPAKALINFPSLNNSGDTIILRMISGEIMDKMHYNTSTYRNNIKSTGGWSLERIDSGFACFAELNWRASVDHTGGTPGRINSVDGKYEDRISPCLLYGSMLNDSTAQIHFSEEVNRSEAINLSNYSIAGTNSKLISVTAVSGSEYNLNFSFSPDTIITIRVVNIGDCAGNKITDCNSALIAKGNSPLINEVLINEILFNPVPGQEDFIELINASLKVIALDSIRLSRRDELGGQKDYTLLQAKGRCIFPGEIIAITKDAVSLKQYYRSADSNHIIEQNIPAMNDESGDICLLNLMAELIDEFRYNDDMHHPLLDNSEGVSLERISVNGPADSSNWHSASSSCGYATPGFKNSQSYLSGGQEKFAILPFTLFSPDNDGEKDVLPVQLQFDRAGYCMRIRIYSSEGMPVKELAGYDLCGMSGTYYWNGQDESGNICKPGHYILQVEAVHPSGIKKSAMKVCALVRRF